jgi:hypothetical protein
MKGAFLSTPTSRISAPFSCNIQRCLDKGLYLSNALQSLSSPLIGHERPYHKYKYKYFPRICQQKKFYCEKIFCGSRIR